MRFCIYIVSVLAVITHSLYAQKASWLWARSAGAKGNDAALSAAIDTAGNIYTAGYYSDSAIFSDTSLHAAKGTKFFLAKYSPGGTRLWIRTSTLKGQSEATSICISQNKYLYLTGYYSDSLLVGSTVLYSAGSAQNFFLAKFDLNGNLLWAASEIASGGDFRKAVAADGLGNAYVCGSFSGPAIFGTTHFTSSGEDIFLAKYAPDATLLWAKKIGGPSDDAAFGIAVSPAGNFVVTGSFGNTTDFGGSKLTAAGISDVFITKFTSDGNLLWAKQAGDSSQAEGSAIALDQNDNIYLTGKFYGFQPPGCDGFGNIYIAKYSPEGNRQWMKCAGSGGEESGKAVAIDKSGNLFVTGANDITIDFGTGELPITGLFDAFIVTFDPFGTPRWADHAAGTGDDEGNVIAIDSSNNIFLAGSFTDTSNFGQLKLTGYGLNDIFIGKIGALSGVSDTKDRLDRISMYPNPAATHISISLPPDMNGDITLILVSELGIVVRKEEFFNDPDNRMISLSLNGLAKGIYLCNIRHNSLLRSCTVELQ